MYASRSRSSSRQSSWWSDPLAAAAAAVTSARLWGWAIRYGPVRSTVPSRRPVRGSKIGLAEHVHGWTVAL